MKQSDKLTKQEWHLLLMLIAIHVGGIVIGISLTVLAVKYWGF